MNDRLAGCLVAVAIVTAPGFANVLVTALTGPDLLDAPAPASVGKPVQEREASPWVAVHPRPQVASRSERRAERPSGRLTDTTCYVATGHRTASGTWPKVGDAASNRYPFGTVLSVGGVGTVVVRDRIGHGSSLDLFFASRSACVRFGRQQLRVEVVRP